MIETTLNDAMAGPIAGAEAHGWQPLPHRARMLFVLARGATLALPSAALGMLLGHLLIDRPLPVAIGGLLAGAAIGAWFGAREFRHVRWRLDADGLAIQRGRLWQRETRVPATRVQHLDLTRGPLQRRRKLATLVVHTAGTRHSAITVPHLDLADAEGLRERLARQIDTGDE